MYDFSRFLTGETIHVCYSLHTYMKTKTPYEQNVFTLTLTKAFPFCGSDRFVDTFHRNSVGGKGNKDFNQIRQTFFQVITNWLDYFQ